MASSGPGVTLGQTGSPYNTGKRRRSVHEEAVDIDSDLSFVFTDGMETAMKVQEVIEKQRQLHSEMEALAPPALLLGGASELADIARMFALLLPEEELSTEDMQALQQLLSPFRRKRCRISLTYPPGLLDIAHAGPFAVESSLSEEGGK